MDSGVLVHQHPGVCTNITLIVANDSPFLSTCVCFAWWEPPRVRILAACVAWDRQEGEFRDVVWGWSVIEPTCNDKIVAQNGDQILL